MTPTWIFIHLLLFFIAPGIVSIPKFFENPTKNKIPNIFAQAWDYIFERIDNSHRSNAGRITFDVHVERVNHSDYALTGNVTFLSPFTHTPDAYHVHLRLLDELRLLYSCIQHL